MPPYCRPGAARRQCDPRAAPISTPPIASANASIACRYRLCSDIVLWPFDITGAEYFTSAGPLQALGLSVGRDVLAGLRLSLTHRIAARIEDEMPDAESAQASRRPGSPAAASTSCRSICCGAEADAIALYEQMIADCVGVYFRYLDDFGDPVIVPAPRDCVRRSVSTRTMRCSRTTTGSFAASICCANISCFRASSSASS